MQDNKHEHTTPQNSHGDCTVADLVAVIVPHKDEPKVGRMFKDCGIISKTIMHALGTVHGGLAAFLGLDDESKTFMMTATPAGEGSPLLQTLAAKLHMEKPGRGIGLRFELNAVYGMHRKLVEEIDMSAMKANESFETSSGYQAIVTIVERGQSDDIMEAANKAGARGGTILHGRGAGVHETQRVFGLEIEPEKEIILILASSETAGAIVSAIRTKCHIDEPGKGIIFVTDVAEAAGLR